MRIVWSNQALRSLADIHSHISTDSEDAANRTVDRILKRGDPERIPSSRPLC
jgi:plasmid stabilization system protein ParE